MSLLLIVLLVVLLAVFVASFAFWVQHGGFLGFYMASQMMDIIGAILVALAHAIGACLSNGSD
jgi:hypothetical protein